jgi:hypothetical protein
MNHLKLDFYQDPGHGWLAVNQQMLTELGITNKITRYSYKQDETVYLEEDCDMPTFLRALAVQKGQYVEYVNHYNNDRSPIRNCLQYSLSD